MSNDFLQGIQSLQFQSKGEAEALLLSFLREIFSEDVISVELRPLAVSLNSFNGFLTLADGKRYFFKTHTESDSVIAEYYNAAQLDNVGYPVIRPIFSSTESGKQLLIYEVIQDQSVFDVAWMIETYNDEALKTLTIAQQNADQQLYMLYMHTLAEQSSESAAKAPIHQLFYHRLVGGRLERFYGPLDGAVGNYPEIQFPHGKYTIDQIRKVKWEINGQQYDDTLNDIIGRSITLLNPAQGGLSIIGHGDAHNGNVFLRQETSPPSLLYFDPAFAGRHHPLLDLTKPIFHNVFAMWMYFPQIKLEQTRIKCKHVGDEWQIEYDYALPAVRHMFLKSKIENVLKPILHQLVQRNSLHSNWRAFFKSALFCCPLLTMNLADQNKFPPEITLLGLAMAVEMGSESIGNRSYIDRVLDDLAIALGI